MNLASASGPLSMSKGTYLARHPAVHGLIQSRPWLGTRLNALTAMQSRLTSRWDGAVSAVDSARTVSLDAHAALTEARNRRFEASGADPKAISAAEAEVANAKALLEDAAQAADAATAGSAHTREAMNNAISALNKLATRKAKIVQVEATVPKGRMDDVILAQRDAIVGLLAQRKRVEDAPPPRDEAEAALVLQASEMARPPTISLSAKSGPRIMLPETHLQLATGPGATLSGMLAVPDSAALFAWMNLDAIIGHIKQTLDERYSHIDLALDRADKAKAIARLDGEILAAERVEVEATMQLADATGLDFGLRKDVSVWAVLGIAPVAGIDEEYNDGLPGTLRLN